MSKSMRKSPEPLIPPMRSLQSRSQRRLITNNERVVTLQYSTAKLRFICTYIVSEQTMKPFKFLAVLKIKILYRFWINHELVREWEKVQIKLEHLTKLSLTYLELINRYETYIDIHNIYICISIYLRNYYANTTFNSLLSHKNLILCYNYVCVTFSMHYICKTFIRINIINKMYIAIIMYISIIKFIHWTMKYDKI